MNDTIELKQFYVDFERVGVTDKRIIHAFKKVKRELFISKEYLGRAYVDAPLPIDEGQTISQPSLVARMTQMLDLRPSDQVLEVGTGSGFQAAILAEVVSEVYTVEVRKNLSASAQILLNYLGYRNIYFHVGDGMQGWKEKAPFDRIIVTAASKEYPQALIDQLKIDGKLLIPMHTKEGEQLQRMTKTKSGLVTERLIPVRFVPIVHGDPRE